MDYLSRFAGCLIGQCLGDALGFPVEGRDGSACQVYLERRANRWFEGEEPELDRWTGQYTDDSQLARELLRSLIENEAWVPGDFARRIAQLFEANRVVGRGIACDQAARNIINGVSWKESGVAASSAGNGTAMRSSPVGLMYHHSPDEMTLVAHEQGWITHHDPRCSAGSVAIAGAVALVLDEDDLHQTKFIGQLSEWTCEYDREFSELIQHLPEWLELEPSEAVKAIAPAGRMEGYVESWPGISPFVVPSVLWSLYSFLRSPQSYRDAVATAIEVGGDVDTTAAMTGAISGAHLGVEALPMPLARQVQDLGEWGYNELLSLATSAASIVQERLKQK